MSASAKKMPPEYFVALVRKLPEPAPNNASVAAPPKASPAPASFFGNCISTKTTRMAQSITIITLSTMIRNNDISVLNRIFNYIGKAAGFERGPAYQRAINVGLAHQLAGIGRLDASTILDAHLLGNAIVKHFRQHAANKRMGILRLLGRGRLPGADGPNRLISQDRLRHLVLGQSSQAAANLRIQHLFGLVRLAFRQSLADAHNRLQ